MTHSSGNGQTQARGRGRVRSVECRLRVWAGCRVSVHSRRPLCLQDIAVGPTPRNRPSAPCLAGQGAAQLLCSLVVWLATMADSLFRSGTPSQGDPSSALPSIWQQKSRPSVSQPALTGWSIGAEYSGLGTNPSTQRLEQRCSQLRLNNQTLQNQQKLDKEVRLMNRRARAGGRAEKGRLGQAQMMWYGHARRHVSNQVPHTPCTCALAPAEERGCHL